MIAAHRHLRLGVNIDHVATIRNARGIKHPDPVRAARVAAEAGADGITAHLREDRRHISDDDIRRLSDEIELPLNLEMAATEEMLRIALRHRPHAACIVPEKRAELTTEGGLDAAGQMDTLRGAVAVLRAAGIRVSLFIDPEAQQIEAAHRLQADAVELHTGTYADAATATTRAVELQRIMGAAQRAAAAGLIVNAGHGLTLDNVDPIAAIPVMRELNIGHSLVADAIFVGLEEAVRRMKARMLAAHDPARG